MANALYRSFRERGFELIHVMTGASNWLDAWTWANSFDPPLEFTVIADTDGGLWSRYLDPNGGCNYVPQGQIFDQGTVTVDDPCTGSGCPSGCGYDDTHVRAVLDAILPPVWCGEASP